jgi:lipopolysaccharide biosynthesis glycosyltransferase
LADEQYSMPLAVMGRSLLEHHRSGRPLLLKVVYGNMTRASSERVERSWQGTNASHARWEWVPPIFGSARKPPVWGRMHDLTYVRLCIDAYFEDCDERAVLLDSDTLLLTDIAELQDIELEEKVIAACVDPFIPTISSLDGLPPFARIGLPPDLPYFNAGIMVVNLARWRHERVGERSIEYVERQRRHLRQYDQDALNAVLAGRIKQLDPSWNTQPRIRNALGIALPDRPRIVHFSGRLKPWLYSGRTELDRRFVECLDRTDWRGFRPKMTWKTIAWNLYDSPLRRLLHGVERRVFALVRTLQHHAS